MKLIFILLAGLFLLSVNRVGSENAAPSHAKIIANYAVIPDVTYLRADNVDLKMDVYLPRGYVYELVEEKKPLPTVVFFHGGGWQSGTKDHTTLQILPYLDKGWAAVNVDYRLSDIALAPAAVEDARCAVWWVKRNAQEYGFDPNRIVLTGQSAGGHLALMAGMLPTSAGLDRRCPENESSSVTSVDKSEHPEDWAVAEPPELKVAAIVNWAGITDVVDLIEGPNIKAYAEAWLGVAENRESLAVRVSPINYVRKGLPPILTLHGDKDTVVPYPQAIRLHKALGEACVQNRLYTIKGARHFGYSVKEFRESFDVIDEFLTEYIPQ